MNYSSKQRIRTSLKNLHFAETRLTFASFKMLFRFPRLRKEALERERERETIVNFVGQLRYSFERRPCFHSFKKKKSILYSIQYKNAHEQIIFSFKLLDLFDY